MYCFEYSGADSVEFFVCI